MAPKMKVLQSKEVLNVSQDYITPDSSQAASPFPPKSQHPQETILVQESNKETDEAVRSHALASALVDDEDDLYGISPRQAARDLVSQRSRVKETQSEDEGDDNSRQRHSGDSHKQAVTIAEAAAKAHVDSIDGSSVNQVLPATNAPLAKLKPLTQPSAESDIIRPAFGKTDAASGTSSHNRKGHPSSASRIPGPTSQTSVMVSGRKGGSPEAALPNSSRPVNKRSALDALREKKGLGAKSQSSQSVRQDITLNPTTSKSDAKAASPTKKPAGRTIATKTADLEPAMQSKKDVSGSVESKTAASIASGEKESLLQRPAQVVTSRAQAADSPGASQSVTSTYEATAQSVPADLHHEGKLKKISASSKGKEAKAAKDAATAKTHDSAASGPDKKRLGSGPSQKSRQTQHLHRDDEIEDEAKINQSPPRKRGKGALPSRPQQAARARRRQAEGSQHDASDPDAEFELSSSSSKEPKFGKKQEFRVTRKTAPKDKLARPTAKATARTTRAQATAAAAQESESDLGSSNEAPTVLDKKQSKKLQRDEGRETRKLELRSRKVKQSGERNDEEAVVDKEAALSKKAPSGTGESKAESSIARPKGQKQTPPREGSRRAAPGCTKENAIELSDCVQSSSPLRPTPTPESERRTDILDQEDAPTESKHSRPRTPAGLPSSPPFLANNDTRHIGPISAAASSRKTQIIGFGKGGPLNQGTLGGKTPGSMPLASDGDRSRLNADRRKRDLSVAMTTRTANTKKFAAPSNVANHVGDALADLKGGINVAEDVGDALFGLNARATTYAPIKPALKQEIHIPVERYPELDDDAGFVHIDEYEETTLVEPDVQEQYRKPLSLNRSASQSAMPPPVKMPAKDKKPANLPVYGDAGECTPIDEVPNFPRAKRTRDPEQIIERTPKRTRAPETQVPRKEIAPTEESVHTGKEKSTVAKEDTPAPRKKMSANIEGFKEASRKRVRDDEAPGATGKRAKVASQPVEERFLEAPEKSAHKTSISKRETRGGRYSIQRRQTSQNSQTVDIAGSPVPPDMEVTGEATVLETFSQQAGLSPDILSSLPTATEKRSNFHAKSGIDSYHPPPSQLTGVLSSNTKPRPAAPQAESTIIPRVSLRDLESLRRHSPLAEAKDPFDSSQKFALSAGAQDAEPSHLDAMMKRFDRLGDRFEHRDPVKRDNTLVSASSPVQQSSPAPIITNKHIRSTQKHYEQFRKITGLRGPMREEEDPEKTLVNDDQDDYEVEENDDDRDPGLGKYLDNSHNDYDVAGVHEASNTDTDDLMSWCKTLRPHQLNLFEELIKCSHRITKFFAEQENNIERTLEQQHEMGLHVIEQDELLRARNYKQLKEKLARVKLDTKRSIHDQQRQMKDQLAARAKEKSSRIIAAGSREKANQELEALLERSDP